MNLVWKTRDRGIYVFILSIRISLDVKKKKKNFLCWYLIVQCGYAHFWFSKCRENKLTLLQQSIWVVEQRGNKESVILLIFKV